MKSHSLITALLVCNFLLFFQVAGIGQIRDKAFPDMQDCEIKFWATLTFYETLAKYEKLDSADRTSRSKEEEAAFYRSILSFKKNAPDQPPPFPSLPKTLNFPDSLKLYQDFFRKNFFKDIQDIQNLHSNVPDVIGLLALTSQIIESIEGDICVPLPLDIEASGKNWYSKVNDIIHSPKDPGPLGKKISDSRSDFWYVESIIGSHFVKPGKKFEAIQMNKKRVVMVIHKDSLKFDPDKGVYVLSSSPLRTQYMDDTIICPDVRFAEQQAIFCEGTGIFVKKNMIATAAHLFSGNEVCHKRDISDYRFIMDVSISDPQNPNPSEIVVDEKNIFVPKSKFIKEGKCFQGDYDWALIRVKPLSRKGKLPEVKVKLQTAAQESNKIYTFGHGLGLPLKFGFDSKLWQTDDPGICYTKLDMFAGNSGSPIFDATTNNLIGILIRGNEDFEYDSARRCLKYIVFSSDAPATEEMQSIKPIANALIKKPKKRKKKYAK